MWRTTGRRRILTARVTFQPPFVHPHAALLASHLVNARRYVVMGVSGAGKSRIGAALAQALDVDFVEGDRYHPARNVERMSAGIALTDEDRAEWLEALAVRLADSVHAGSGLVMSCSALKRSYRDILRGGATDVRLVYLKGSPPLLAERIAARTGHFMPRSLLESQLATLEEPGPDEDAWVLDIARPPEDIIADLAARART